MKTIVTLLLSLGLATAAFAQQTTQDTAVAQPTITIQLPPVVIPPVPVTPFQFPAWQNVPYDVNNFTGYPGTWDVPSANINTNRYQLLGTTLHWSFSSGWTTLAGSINAISVKIPGGKVAKGLGTCVYQYVDATGGHTGIGYAFDTSPYLSLYHADTSTNWTVSPNGTTAVNFTCTFEVQ